MLYRVISSIAAEFCCPGVVQRCHVTIRRSIAEMAAKRDFTDRFLKAIKAASKGKRVLYRDAQTPGFGIRVTDKSVPGGIGSFVLVARFPGSNNPIARHIGDYPAMSLAQAREIAREWREDLRQGVDPKTKAERQRREDARHRAETFEVAFESYYEDRLKQLRTGDVVRSTVRRLAYPKWGDRPIKELRRSDVVELISGVRGAMPISANRLLSYLKTFFLWAIDEELIDDSPAATVKRPTSEKERARERTLSDTELGAVWRACDELGVFGRAFKVMLLTGQRRTEVGAMRWSELNLRDRTWMLPKARTKAKRSHEVPLSDAAIEIITKEERLSNYVFTGRRRPVEGVEGDLRYGAISGWGKAKESLDRVAAVKAREIAEGIGDDDAGVIQPWHLHDLRRTCATRLGKLGFTRVVIAKVLNHAIAGVTSTYDHHDYAAEKRQALDAWARKFVEIVNGAAASNVVALAGARKA
jgi:integrase